MSPFSSCLCPCWNSWNRSLRSRMGVLLVVVRAMGPYKPSPGDTPRGAENADDEVGSSRKGA